MKLIIDTTNNNQITITLKSLKGRVIAVKQIEAPYQQSEKLLPGVESLLNENNKMMRDLREIIVVNYGGSFTSLRIGVVTANALGYALGIPVKGTSGQTIKNTSKFDIVEPAYLSEPNISKEKKKV